MNAPLCIWPRKVKAYKFAYFQKIIPKQTSLDIRKANEQYGGITAKVFTKSHDRFLIIDDVEVYHLGASLKDLGKKWFRFFRKWTKARWEAYFKRLGVIHQLIKEVTLKHRANNE